MSWNKRKYRAPTLISCNPNLSYPPSSVKYLLNLIPSAYNIFEDIKYTFKIFWILKNTKTHISLPTVYMLGITIRMFHTICRYLIVGLETTIFLKTNQNLRSSRKTVNSFLILLKKKTKMILYFVSVGTNFMSFHNTIFLESMSIYK